MKSNNFYMFSRPSLEITDSNKIDNCFFSLLKKQYHTFPKPNTEGKKIIMNRRRNSMLLDNVLNVLCCNYVVKGDVALLELRTLIMSSIIVWLMQKTPHCSLGKQSVHFPAQLDHNTVLKLLLPTLKEHKRRKNGLIKTDEFIS